MAGRATPEMMTKYKHALQLHKVYNSKEMGEDWIRLNFNQNFNQRISKFITTDDSGYKVGKNLLANRLTILHNTIELCDINKSFNTYKLTMKKLFMSFS